MSHSVAKEVLRYTPAGRVYHQAVSINGKVYMWGGAGNVNPRAVEVFDPCTETWVQYITKGTPHPGVYSVACTASEGHLYAYGGVSDTIGFHAELSKLDVSTFTWSCLSPQDPNGGPMEKWECGLVCFHGSILTVFGGYGIPSDLIQPGSELIQDERYKNGLGWTNELHTFNLKKGKCSWFSPSVRGTRPPPCRNFTFVCINERQALLYGGYLPEGELRVSDLYLFDFSDSQTMDIVKLEPKVGDKWPVGRACHAGCCLGYSSDNPVLFIIGGGTTDERVLQDAWLFDVLSRLWTELVLPLRENFPRCYHVATSTTLFPGYEEVTIFGGSVIPDFGSSIHDGPKLTNTELFTFEKSTDMVTVTHEDELGTFKNIHEKLFKICTLSRNAKVVEESAAKDSSQVSLALIERERAQEQVRRLEERLVIESDKKKAAKTKVKRVEEAKKQQEEDFAEELSQAIERAQVAEKRSHDLEQRSHDAEQRLHDAELRATAAERQLHSAEQRAMEASRRAQHTKMQTQNDQCWVLQRSEIEITEEEIGRGGWAAVKVAKFRGTRVAAKCFYQQILVSQYNCQLFNREMHMAAHLRHPNLVQFIGASLEGEPIILTELMTTSLRAVLESGPIHQSVMISVSLDITRALNYLHLMKPHPIIHRDISSANVLLDPLPDNQWKAKVSDYGSVNVLQQLQTVGPGNPVYAAPEASTPALQSPKMDIFSFGILLVEMLTDQFPQVDSRQHLITLIDHNGFSRLVRCCLNEDRDQRPSASGLIVAITDLHC